MSAPVRAGVRVKQMRRGLRMSHRRQAARTVSAGRRLGQRRQAHLRLHTQPQAIRKRLANKKTRQRPHRVDPAAATRPRRAHQRLSPPGHSSSSLAMAHPFSGVNLGADGLGAVDAGGKANPSQGRASNARGPRRGGFGRQRCGPPRPVGRQWRGPPRQWREVNNARLAQVRGGAATASIHRCGGWRGDLIVRPYSAAVSRAFHVG
jgi:hypothetical protein